MSAMRTGHGLRAREWECESHQMNCVALLLRLVSWPGLSKIPFHATSARRRASGISPLDRLARLRPDASVIVRLSHGSAGIHRWRGRTGRSRSPSVRRWPNVPAPYDWSASPPRQSQGRLRRMDGEEPRRGPENSCASAGTVCSSSSPAMTCGMKADMRAYV